MGQLCLVVGLFFCHKGRGSQQGITVFQHPNPIFRDGLRQVCCAVRQVEVQLWLVAGHLLGNHGLSAVLETFVLKYMRIFLKLDRTAILKPKNQNTILTQGNGSITQKHVDTCGLN